MMKRFIMMLFLVLTAAVSLSVMAQSEDDEIYGDRPAKMAEAQKRHEANLKKYKGKKDFLVLPGLVADRKNKQVDVLCETTTLEARSSAEYMIIYKDSGHGYESMLWSYAKPSDLHKALEFIGMRAGSPVDPSMLRFWPKGERVIASVVMGDHIVRLEQLIYDTQKETTLPEEGFIFTGSVYIDNPTGGTERVYLADTYDPKSIIPAYNEPASVMDPPWKASKGEFYDSHVASPDFSIPAHDLITVRFEPEYKDGRQRVYDLDFEIKADGEFILKESKTGKQIAEKPTFDSAIKKCKEIIEDEREPYVTVVFDDKLRLEQIQQICSMLFMLDIQNGIRVEPPTSGKLYYRAFMPNPQWKNAADRMLQPWELHIKVDDKGKLSGTMVMYDMHWKRHQTRPDLTKRTFDVASADDIMKTMKAEDEARKADNKRAVPRAILIFLPKTILYGDLMKFLPADATKDHSIHLFFDEEEKAAEEPEKKVVEEDPADKEEPKEEE